MFVKCNEKLFHNRTRVGPCFLTYLVTQMIIYNAFEDLGPYFSNKQTILQQSE